MFDFPGNPDLARLIETIDRDGKLIAAVCHGPAALAGPTRPDGAPLVQGRKMAAFTDNEERAVDLDKGVPFLLASRLVAPGADHHSANEFEPFALRDGTLVTSQNPQLAKKVAQMVLDALDDVRPAA
jgi:putative intracellular protease/amidase